MNSLPDPRALRLEEIYAAALKVFARYGPRRARVEDIATSLGMTKGNLYHYVASKDELYLRTVEWALSAWYRSIESGIASASSAAEGFRRMARLSFEYAASNEELRSLLEEDPTIFSLDPATDRFAAANRAARDLLGRVLASGLASGEFRRELEVEATTDFLYAVYIAFLIKTYPLGGGWDCAGRAGSAALVEAGIDLAVAGLMARGDSHQSQGAAP